MNMAERRKTGIFTRASTIITRTKTKVLQNLGKAEKTTDETFDEHVHKLDKQQEVAARFQKELRNYIHCARAMSTASKSFYHMLQETYEADWSDQQAVEENIQTMDLMWTNFIESLQESASEPLAKRMNHFHPLKAKILKRGRKLVDYDNAKHNLEVQQTAKKKEEVKITKAQEDMNKVKKIYEELNSDLNSELPTFYNSRITFYGSIFQSIFSAENIFHSELSQSSSAICDISEKLGKEYEMFQYQPRSTLLYTALDGQNGNDQEGAELNDYSTPRDICVESPGDEATKMDHDTERTTEDETDKNQQQDTGNDHNETLVNHTEQNSNDSDVYEIQEFDASDTKPTSQEDCEPSSTYMNFKDNEVVNGDVIERDKTIEEVIDFSPQESPTESSDEKNEHKIPEEPEPDEPNVTESSDEKNEHKIPDEPEPDEPNVTESSDEKNEHKIPDEPEPDKPNISDESEPLTEKITTILEDTSEEDLYQTPQSNKPLDKSDVLFEVKSTHPYSGDSDELKFESGEIIEVFPNPDDEDDGWLYGRRKLDGKMGMFPENFTKKL